MDIQPCSEGGYNVGWIAAGEWIRYTNVQVTRGGNQEIRIRGAAWNQPEQVRVCDGGLSSALVTLTIPVTGAFQKWQTISAVVPMTEGAHTIYLYAETGDFNLNWFEIRPVIDFTPPNAFQISTQPSGSWTNAGVTATFAAADNGGGSGIKHYEGKLNQGQWITPISSPWTISSTDLVPGTNAIWVRAYDYAGYYRDGVRQVYYAEQAQTIAAAKALPDNQFRSLKGKIVTLAGDGFFYIEEPDRTAGIKIISPQPVSIGSRVDLAGTLSGSATERYIDCGPNPVFVISP